MTPNINVSRLDAQPNNCPLTDPLTLEIDFSTDGLIQAGVWEISYIVDHTATRHLIEMGKSSPTVYTVGDHKFAFTVPSINVTGIKRSSLSNMGLLLAVLKDGDEEVIQISMVTQCSEKSGQFFRTIFNPLE
eukprot:TRINITY_DN15458_c0_g1_i1.p1 TRINITY_DN15458_c0_g1~~TRINITY_DN15458_c0_g1_i1.p1  ORF type:complete len:150 (-),score=28.29 TRINITY_DN15458_c0_g1_i1:35-430(-)